MHLDRRESLKCLGNCFIGHFPGFFKGFPLDKFGCHTAGCNCCSTPKGLEFYIGDDIILHGEENSHNIPTGGVPYLSDTVSLIYLPLVAGVHEMVHYFFAIHCMASFSGNLHTGVTSLSNVRPLF